MEQYLPILYFLGFIALGAGYLYIQWAQGGNKASSEVISTYKTQVEQLRGEVVEEKKGRTTDKHDLQNKIQSLALELEHMKGATEEKDKKIKEFTEIFQGKNPELVAILSEIRDFMKGLNEQSLKNQKRNEAMDKK